MQAQARLAWLVPGCSKLLQKLEQTGQTERARRAANPIGALVLSHFALNGVAFGDAGRSPSGRAFCKGHVGRWSSEGPRLGLMGTG